MIEIKLTTKQAKEIEQHVEEHMYFCHVEAMGDEVPDDWEPFAPFCGCDTCESREYIMSFTNKLRSLGIVDIYVDEYL